MSDPDRPEATIPAFPESVVKVVEGNLIRYGVSLVIPVLDGGPGETARVLVEVPHGIALEVADGAAVDIGPRLEGARR